MQNKTGDGALIKNEKLPDAAGRLGVQPVGKLLINFSIPAVSGMVLNALYNIVDRIFVGKGVNELALGGLSYILPLQTFTMAFAMLFGVGSANLISMRLGEGRREDAQKALNCCFWLLLGAGVILAVAGLIFMEIVLGALGAEEGSVALGYTAEYYPIIAMGLPLFLVSFGLTHCARAQGFPMVSMIGMIIGATTNTVLDPVFIFIFKWGVKGAALATIISQALAALWIMSFILSKKAVLRLSFSAPKRGDSSLSFKTITTIISFGSAQFFLQFAVAGSQWLLNRSMGWYGASSLGVANGGDIAVTGMNIIGTVIMFTLMPVFGINQGAQPVLGFNYGAKKFERVRRAFILAVLAATAICTAGFLVTSIFPDSVVRLFTREPTKELMDWTVWAMRAAVIFLPLNGFQIVSSNFFVVTGRAKTSIFLSLTRQVIVLIPCILILGKLFGVRGVISSMPAADFAALIITSVMIGFELKKLRRSGG